jgi:aryl-alcohol dehydrogenase-like predicted oxidoreductase
LSPRFQGENFQKNLDLVKEVEEIAHDKKCQPSQLALAWVLAQGDDIVPIPGTKRRKYLEENAAAADLRLTVDDLRRLSEVFPSGAASGTRLPGTHDESGQWLMRRRTSRSINCRGTFPACE